MYSSEKHQIEMDSHGKPVLYQLEKWGNSNSFYKIKGDFSENLYVSPTDGLELTVGWIIPTGTVIPGSGTYKSWKGKVTADQVAIREEPYINPLNYWESRIIGYLALNQEVTVYGSESGFYDIGSGYVYSQYIVKINN
jgi:hypothetical protein